MITFSLSQEQQLAQASAHAAARDFLRPAARRADAEGSLAPDVMHRLWDLGLVHLQTVETRDPVLNALVLEELGWGDAACGLAIAGSMAVVQAVAKFGTEAQISEVIPALTEEHPASAAIAITEPSFNFDVSNLKTAATRTATGYRISGIKSWVPCARECLFYLVVAMLDGALDAFIIPAKHPGISVEPTSAMGLRSLGFGRVRFDNVELSGNMRLGDANGSDCQRIINCSRVGTAAILTGLSRAVYDYVKDYTLNRVAHGSVLAQKQSVGFRLVDMYIAVEAMRWMVWKAASEIGSPAFTRSAKLAHVYACEQATWITDEGVQLLGGHGFLKDHLVELWYRNAKSLTVLEGLASV